MRNACGTFEIVLEMQKQVCFSVMGKYPCLSVLEAENLQVRFLFLFQLCQNQRFSSWLQHNCFVV